MIKATLEINEDDLYFDGKLIEFVMGAKSDYWQIEDVGITFKSLESIIAYCMEQSND